MNKNKQSNILEYYYQFLREIEVIKSYLIEFKKNSSMKSKIYPDNCLVSGLNYYPLFLSHMKKLHSMPSMVIDRYSKKKIILYFN